MPYPGWPGQQHAGCTYEDALFTSFGAPKNNIIIIYYDVNIILYDGSVVFIRAHSDRQLGFTRGLRC
eukprot:COSAG01_NODE_411_length_17360_cov_11.401852_3_plen_67_part_00